MPVQQKQINELFEHNKTVVTEENSKNEPTPKSEQHQYSKEDQTHFKNIVMQLICKGATDEVEQMLQNAP